MDLENQSRQVLQTALKPVRRRAFIRSYLLVLWPDSERLLLALARRLGDEVREPHSDISLLTASLAAGIRNFDQNRKREGYDPSTWVANVFLYFWQAAIETAAEVMGFRGHSANGVWNPAYQPFLDWRLEHPGKIEWDYQPSEQPALETGRLFNLLLGPKGRRPWVVEEVLRRFG